MLSVACQWLCWFWGFLGGTVMKAHVRCCLWLAPGHLFEATQWSTVLLASAGPGDMQGEPSCTPKQGFTNTQMLGQVRNFLRHCEVHLCLLPAGSQLGSVTKTPFGSPWVSWSRSSVTQQVEWVVFTRFFLLDLLTNLSFEHSFYMLDINPFSEMWFYNILFLSMAFGWILLAISFIEQKVLYLCSTMYHFFKC